jgi:hypothetical protein
MRLIPDDLPEMNEVTAAQIEQVLGDEAFGEFVILRRSEDAFIQAACVWEPGAETLQFLEQTGSDPFRLEYRDETGPLLAADGSLTLAQVTQAFLDYLAGRTEWRDRYTWSEVDLD